MSKKLNEKRTLFSHDFDQIHGGNGRPGSNLGGCEGTGIMSYGSKSNPRNPSASPIAWSTCSNSDFSKWYRRDGHACLKPGAGGGGGGGGEGTGRTLVDQYVSNLVQAVEVPNKAT